MKIQVTQDHIDRGEREQSEHCAVALAMQDAGLKFAAAGSSFLHWNGYRNSTTQPLAVREFIKRFDAGEPVEPFEFELEEEVCIRP